MSHSSESVEAGAGCKASASPRLGRKRAPAQASADKRRGLPRGRGGPIHERSASAGLRAASRERQEELKPLGDFYRGGAEGEDPVELAAARDVQGLEEEIALLRLRVRHLLKEKPEDFRLVLLGINTLVRAVAAESRLAGADQEKLARRMAEAVSQLSSLIEED